ncbi:MAG: TIGR04086 family membrane protein [Lachnospiraceae bacterium]|nr:TIGR04086 family membrane protein [Lachnospiraceae bacterium]
MDSFMEKKKFTSNLITDCLQMLLLAYVITGGMLLLLALLLYRFQLGETAVSVGIILIYVLTTFVCGLLMAKKRKKWKFLWGLMLGIFYYAVLLAVSLLVNNGAEHVADHLMTAFLLCAGSGMLGGMLG